MNLRGNSHGPILWCLVFIEILNGQMTLKVCQEFPLKLALVHGWLFLGLHVRRHGTELGIL